VRVRGRQGRSGLTGVRGAAPASPPSCATDGTILVVSLDAGAGCETGPGATFLAGNEPPQHRIIVPTPMGEACARGRVARVVVPRAPARPAGARTCARPLSPASEGVPVAGPRRSMNRIGAPGRRIPVRFSSRAHRSRAYASFHRGAARSGVRKKCPVPARLYPRGFRLNGRRRLSVRQR